MSDVAWSASNHLDFLTLRVEDCDRLFRQFLDKLCSPERKNVAAQIELFEEAQRLAAQVDTTTEAIQKYLGEMGITQENMTEQFGIWERRIVAWKDALTRIGTALSNVVNGAPGASAQVVEAVGSVDYNCLDVEPRNVDQSIFEAITFSYLRDRFDHCLCLLQSIFNNFLRRTLRPEDAHAVMAMIREFNSDFALQKQNIQLYESALFENLSFRTDTDPAAIENELNQLATFADSVDKWSRLPLAKISGVSIQPAGVDNGLVSSFESIDFTNLGLDHPSPPEFETMASNLLLFRPKFESRKLAWLWVSKMKLDVPLEGEENDDDADADDDEDAMTPDVLEQTYDRLARFMSETEKAVDVFIESLLTCNSAQATFDGLNSECERLKLILRTQRRDIRRLYKQLGANNPGLQYGVAEWRQLVELWLRVLQSLTNLLQHLHNPTNAGSNTEFDDVLEQLRNTIERDLFIPEANSAAGGNGPEVPEAQME
uniref:Conserved oligomeric Golgi complex subunit 1 n=1 Tax=Panagrellus redivivus TaxID=6233 RepID=A0A7E4ZU46_PANRE